MNYYDQSGNPITEEEWMGLRAAHTELDMKTLVGTTLVSTVWLGLDFVEDFGSMRGKASSESGSSQPLIFETLVSDESEELDIIRRYRTLQSAIEGHWRAVELAKRTHVLRGGEWISPWDWETGEVAYKGSWVGS